MKGFFQSIFKISFLLAISFSSFGQVVTFSFTGGDGSQLTNAPDAQPSNATVSSMSRGSGLTTFNGFTNGFNAYEWGPAATLDANDYYEFTITPDAGYTMTLSSFVFDDRWVDPFANDTYFWTLRSSLDGFSSDVATPVSFAVTQAGSPDTHTGITFNLPGGTFTNVSTPIIFRLYGYDVTNPGNLELGIDNVDLNGTINSPTKTSIATIDFESVNYTLSTPTGPDTDSFWAVFAASDEGTGHSFLGGAPAGVEGANYLAYRDGNNIGGTQTMVNTTPIDVSSFENIDLIFSLSNPDLGGDQYEITDEVKIEYQYDGGGYQFLTQWAGDGASYMSEDADDSGGGDGVASTLLGPLFKSFTRSIPKEGTMLDLRFSVLTTNESVIIDNIAVFGTTDVTAPTASAPTSVAQTLRGTISSTSTVESTEFGNIYLVRNGVAAASQANIDAAVTANDAFLGRQDAQPNTPYTVTPLTTLNDGVYDIVAVDAAGNVSSIVAGWLTVDNTPPSAPAVVSISTDTGISGTDEITNDNTITITGTAEANSTVEVFIDAGSIGITTANGSGDWTYDHTAVTLADNAYAITAQASDVAGNTSGTSGVLNIVIDTNVAIPTVASIADDNGSSGADEVTNDNTITITGTAEANASVEVFIDAGSIGTTTADGSGDWTYDHTAVTLADNTYSITAQATDVAGNVSAISGGLSITIDTGSPAAPTVVSIANDNGISGSDEITNDNTITITGTAEANATVEVFINAGSIGTTTANGSGDWTYDHTAVTLADNTYSITARATDLAGNQGPTSGGLSVTIDTGIPAAPTVVSISTDTGISGTDEITNDNTITITGTAEANSTVEVFIDAGSIGTTTANGSGDWTYDHTAVTLADNAYAITAQASDVAGNTSGTSAALNIVIDTNAATPTVASIADDNGSSGTDEVTNDNTITITGTAEANASVEVFIDAGSIGTTTANGSGDWTYDHTAVTLADNNYSITAQATDVAGNVSAISGGLSITIDTGSPAAPTVVSIANDNGISGSDEITNDNTITITGTAEANATVEVFINAGSIGTTTANGSGDWTYDHTAVTLADNTYSITARATDLAGNQGSTSGGLSVTIDTGIPAAPTVVSISTDTGISGTDEITNDNTITITGTAEANSTVEVFIDAGSIGTTTANGSGDWTYDHTAVTLADNAYAITAQASDVAGNTSGTSAALNIVIDTAPPIVNSNEFSVTSPTTIEFTLNEELSIAAGAVSGFSVGGGTSTFTSATYSGKGTTNTITILGNNFSGATTTVSYTPVGTAIDLAGNEMATINNALTTVNEINLAEGDIAITSYRSDDTDTYAFVLLKDAPAGTKIKFTDNGWKGTVAQAFSSGERVVTWEATSYIFAGTEITISGTTATGGGTLSAPSGALELSDSGDQILAYQGTEGNPTFLFAIQMDGNTWDGNFSGNSNNESALPRGLTDGLNAIDFANERDNGSYNRFGGVEISVGTPGVLLASIGDRNNWDIDDNPNNVTYPTAGKNYTIPPDLQSTTPANLSTVSAGLTELVFTYDVGETMSLFSGNINLNLDDGTPVASWNTITDAGLFSISGNEVTLDISSKVSFGASDNGKIYEVDVTDLAFENSIQNRTESVVGDTDFKFTMDAQAPTVNFINRGTASPLNANFGTTASSVTYTVEFSEDVQPGTVTIADFTTAGAASGGTETVSNVSGGGDTYTVTVSGINQLGDLTINFTGAVNDLVGNTGNTGAAGNQSFVIINPEPSQQPSGINVTQGANNFTLDVTWTAGAGAQLADGYLVLYKTAAGSFPADPTDLIAQANTFDGTNGVLNMATNSASISGLNSGVQYDIKIYPYTNSGNQIDYKTDGTILTGSGTTGTGSDSRLYFAGDAATVSSLNNALGTAVINFSFYVYDDDGGFGVNNDNAPTLINQISYQPGAGNDINWADAIEGVELSDDLGSGVWNSNSNGGDITVDNSQITFSNLPTGVGQLGYLGDDAFKQYQLKIWLKNPIADANLQNTIDGLNLAFNVNTASFTYASGSSQVLAGQTQSSGATRNAIAVVATALNWETQPPSNVGVAAPFSVAPVIEAVDANGNRDLNYAGAITTLSNAGGFGMNNNPDASGLALSFASGIYTFDILTNPFSYQGSGDGTLTITSGALSPSPSSSTVTVSYSDGTTITAGADTEPLTIPSTQTAIVDINAYAFDFTITDDALASIDDKVATIISQLVITASGGTDVLATNWNDVIQQALLYNVATGQSDFALPADITSNTITFDLTGNSLGTIADDANKTFRLYIALKSSMTNGYNNIIDNMYLNFLVSDGTINTAASSSTFASSQTEISGATNNKIDVSTTQITFDETLSAPSQQPDPSALYGTTLSTQPIATARDANNNLDKDYAGPVNITNTAGLPMNNASVTFNNGAVELNPSFSFTPGIGAPDNTDTRIEFTDAGIPAITANSDIINVTYSGESDIIRNASFNRNSGSGYRSNIPYEDFQGVTITGSSDSEVLEGFTIRDGGGSSDADGSATIINSITMDIVGFNNLRAIELYDAAGTTPMASTGTNEQNVIGSTVTFTGLSLTAPNNGSIDFTVRASFKDVVTDNETISFLITNVVESATASQLLNSDGSTSGGTVPESSLSGDENKIIVIADRLNFTTSPVGSLSAFSDASSSFVVEAQDALGNTDLDYTSAIGTVTTQNFTPTNPLTFTPTPTSSFVLGVYDFSINASGFQFETEGTTGELVVSASGLTDGVSSTFSVFASDESDIIFDNSELPAVRITTTANRESDGVPHMLGKFTIRDGGSDLTDLDAGNTTLKSLNISISNFENLDKVGLYDALDNLIEEKDAAATLTFDNSGSPSGLNISAIDLDNAGTGVESFYLKATLKDAIVDDTELIQVTITGAVAVGGSQFTPVWVTSNTPADRNIVDVITTNFVFTTFPNFVEGVDTPLLSTPDLEAVDIYGNLDIEYNGSFSINPAEATTNQPSGIFSGGQVTLTGLQYTTVGDGTLTISAAGITSGISTNVEVVTTAFTQYNTDAYPPVGDNEISTGVDDRTLIGINLVPQSTDPSFEVHFDNLTVEFSENIDDYFENIRLYEVVDPAGISVDIDFVEVPGATVNVGLSTAKTLVFTGFDEVLTLGTDNSYLIVADISPSAFGGPVSLTVSPQTSYLQSNNGNMTGSIATSKEFRFIDNQGPIIVATDPVNKSIAVPVDQNEYFITFDENTFPEDPFFELKRFTQIGETVATISKVTAVSPKSFKIEFFADEDYNIPIILEPAKPYAITLQKLGFRDGSGNFNITASTGSNALENDIENVGFWSFTTRDNVDPTFIFDTDNSELIAQTYDNGFDFKVKLDEPGDVFVRVLDKSFTPAVGALGDEGFDGFFDTYDATVSVDIADEFYYMSVRGLDASPEQYDIYFGAKDKGGNESDFNNPNEDSKHVQKRDNEGTATAASNIVFSNFTIDLCRGEFQPITAPFVIQEANDNDFTNGIRKFDLTLPDGYTFNKLVGIATRFGASDIPSNPSITYPNNSTARISFEVTSEAERNEIRITGLEIKAEREAESGPITLNSNFGVFDETAGQLNLADQPIAGIVLDPPGFVINANNSDTQKIALAQLDSVFLYDNQTYEFSGPGVFNDTLYVNLAGLGAKTITLTQTVDKGCQSVGDVEVNIVDSQFSGLDFTYCSNQELITAPLVPPTGSGDQFEGYRLVRIEVDDTTNIDPINRANVLSFELNATTFTFDPQMAIPSGNTEAEYVALNFVGKYERDGDPNDTVALSQTVRVYRAPEVTLVSTTFRNDFDGTIEVCADASSVSFAGSPISGSGASGVYTLTLIGSSPLDVTSEIISNSDRSISINPASLAPGTYLLEYTYSSSVTTCEGVASINLIIYDLPDITITEETSCAGQSTIINNTITLDNGNDQTLEYLWTFDDLTSSNNTSSDSATSHIFATSGVYEVELQVTTENGCINTTSKEVTVGGVPQTAFTYTGVNVSDVFSFISTTDKPSPLDGDVNATYTWDFGDGSIESSSSSEITHSYTSTLIDSISLTVITTLGCEKTQKQQVTVLDKYLTSEAPSDGQGWVVINPTNNSWTLSSLNDDIGQGGNTMWVTNPNTSYLPNEQSYVYSPTYDFSDINRPLVQFDAYWDLTNGGVLLQYSTDSLNISDSRKTWSILGSLASGEDWYNASELSLPTVSTGVAWSENMGLQEPRHVLDDFINLTKRGNVNFRFAFLSQDKEPSRPGYAFDNFVIGERTRTVLVENFTNTSQSNLTLQESNYLKTYDVEDDIGTVLVKINYHTDFPSDDPINASNKVDPSARALFYNVSQTPRAIIDGTINDPLNQNRPFSAWGQTSFDLRSLILAQFDIDLNVTTSDGVIKIDAIPTPQSQAVADKDIMIMAAVLEKEVTLNELNINGVASGETSFEFVLRKLLPNAAGIMLNTSPITTGTPLAPVSFEWTPDNIVDPSDLAVVVIIQDIETKEVYQTELWLDVPTPDAVTAIEEARIDSFSFYPNPANDQVTILFNQKLHNGILKIYDNFGKLVFDKAIEETSLKLSTQDFASGMYHIQVSTNDDTIVRKRLIITHNDR